MKIDIMYSLQKEDNPSEKLKDIILKTYIEANRNSCKIIVAGKVFDYMNDKDMKILIDGLINNFSKNDIDLFFTLIAESIEKTNFGLCI